MGEILVDAPSRLVKSYEQHMVGGEGVLPCCVTPDSSTEPLVNTIRGWGKWWGSEDLESSRGLSKADLVSPGRALCSELHTISPFFLLQTQIGKETITDKSPEWTRNLIPGRNLPIPVWSVSPPQLPHPVQCLCLMLFYRNRYCSFLPALFMSLTAGGVQPPRVCICNPLLGCSSRFTGWDLRSREYGSWAHIKACTRPRPRFLLIPVILPSSSSSSFAL